MTFATKDLMRQIGILTSVRGEIRPRGAESGNCGFATMLYLQYDNRSRTLEVLPRLVCWANVDLPAVDCYTFGFLSNGVSRAYKKGLKCACSDCFLRGDWPCAWACSLWRAAVGVRRQLRSRTNSDRNPIKRPASERTAKAERRSVAPRRVLRRNDQEWQINRDSTQERAIASTGESCLTE